MCSGRDARAPANACSELRRRASLPCRPCVQVVGSILWTVEEGQEVAKGAEVGGESSGEGGVPLGGRQCWWVNRCKVGHSPGQGPAIRVQGRMQGGVPTCAHPPPPPPGSPQVGYFAFGGSTIVLLFQKGAVDWDGDLVQNRWVVQRRSPGCHQAATPLEAAATTAVGGGGARSSSSSGSGVAACGCRWALGWAGRGCKAAIRTHTHTPARYTSTIKHASTIPFSL